jgi:hypothetical protein
VPLVVQSLTQGPGGAGDAIRPATGAGQTCGIVTDAKTIALDSGELKSGYQFFEGFLVRIE